MAMEGAMRCLYWLCKEEVPHTTKFASLLDLCKSLGVDVLNSLKQGGNASYTSECFIQEAVTTLGQQISTPLLQKMRDSCYFSVMVDETTDVGVKKELIIYIRYLNSKGESDTRFSGMLELRDGKAETIVNAITDQLHSNDLQLKNMCALGSDGAAVMMGCRNGIAAKLKEQVSHLLNNHCVAHRLALASSQAANHIPYLKKFKAIVEQLYRFYNYSPVRIAALHEIQAILNDPRINITRAKDMRWLSHDAAIQSIRKTFKSLVTNLEQEAQERSDVQAMGLSVFVQTYNFVATLYMLSDVLPILSQLSKAMQRRDLDYTVVKPLVTGAINTVSALNTNPGQYFCKLPEVMENLADKPFRFSFPTPNQANTFKTSVYDKYIDQIIRNLEHRFPDLPMLEAFNVFDVSLMPENSDELHAYGREEIEMLCDHYHLDTERTHQEWSSVKHLAKEVELSKVDE